MWDAPRALPAACGFGSSAVTEAALQSVTAQGPEPHAPFNPQGHPEVGLHCLQPPPSLCLTTNFLFYLNWLPSLATCSSISSVVSPLRVALVVL